MLVFVYGTLRKGDCRAGILDDYKCVAEEAYLQGFTMLDLGAFPGIIPINIPTDHSIIRGELYEIDKDCLQILDNIEGYFEDNPQDSLYLRQKVTVDVYTDESEDTYEDVFTYVLNYSSKTRYGEAPIIKSGNWFDKSKQILISRTT